MHKFGGRWTSTVYNHASGEVPQKRDDGHFMLDMDNDGTFRRNKHIRASGEERDIEAIEHERGLILKELDPERVFSGVEFLDIVIFKMLLGDVVRRPARPVRHEKAAEADVAGQEQGTWVVTQP